MKKALITLSLPLVTVGAALAQIQGAITNQTGTGSVAGQGLINLINTAQTILSLLVPLFIGVAVIVFFYFLVKFITQGAESGDKRSEAIKGMAFSVLALFVMVSIWGLVGLLGSFVGVNQGGNVPAPGIPVPCGGATGRPC